MGSSPSVRAGGGREILRRRAVILSPIVLIALCHASQIGAGRFLGVWAWVPTILVFWGFIAAIIFWAGPLAERARWLKPGRGSLLWPLLAVFVGAIPLPILLRNWHLLESSTVFVLWLAFAVLNPWFEEGYWRGLLLDATRHWPAPVAIAYSTAMFVVSHPLIWGVHSLANRHVHAFVALFVMGAIWALVYRRTGTLRAVIFAHLLADLFNLAVPVFLNLYVPPA